MRLQGNGCGFAPILAIYTDSPVWAENHKPGWYSGPLTADDTMVSSQACQEKCQATDVRAFKALPCVGSPFTQLCATCHSKTSLVGSA